VKLDPRRGCRRQYLLGVPNKLSTSRGTGVVALAWWSGT
jgi:hypothetical protein